ncbi:polyamine aminopropyltransferase [Gracilibacillus oryzae]|uniref:Polyamine aminopropyltransferase n=1 Tax=Gracilibacillus oryzae TaxID=1672701 RepID=A0A7C8KQV7_9BACI|nr:polyamine aminopropyltransferase [Gracilibacillus oryzae]KAB8137747.1 polyamine aminopropyltransferase [Gracilibacillus oryzae]
MSTQRYLYFSSGIVSICGIVYQVLYGAAGSYLFGDSVLFYCITIGLFLMAMGIGAALSERIKDFLVARFIQAEYMIALIGGLSIFGLFFIIAYFDAGIAQLYLYIVISLTGFFTGLELPILIRRVEDIREDISKSTARVLFFDYAGSLIGSIGFALLLRPMLGLIKTAFFIAIINAVVALVVSIKFQREIHRPLLHKIIGGALIIFLTAGFLFGEGYANSFEQRLYSDPIIYSEETEYQKIIMTKEPEDVRLFLNGQLQFAESDEFRYHEALIHVPMSLAEDKQRVLILGAGDGLAVRELLKYDEVEQITVVDLDPMMTELARTHPDLLRLNENSMSSDKVKIIHEDAFNYLMDTKEFYNVIIGDLPDPNNEALNKLYTKEFYSLIRNHLMPGGMASIQSTSPLFATKAFWTINNTVKATGLHAESYHLDVPSFGNWGFVLASREPIDAQNIDVQVETQYLTNEIAETLFSFGKDIDKDIVEDGETFELPVNSLNRPVLLPLYENAWKYY